MDIAFPIIAFFAAFLGTSRSLGLGFAAIFGVGFFSGVIRANFLGVFTTFMFDAGILGLYLGFLINQKRWAGKGYGMAGKFSFLLIGWPAMLALLPVNDLLIQLVALRSVVWFLPVMLIATRLTSRDLTVITRWLAIFNLCALAGGIYVYLYGVEALYPQNAVTQIIYLCKDVGGGLEYHRVPSIFLSAHAYGAAMLFTLPFLLDRVFGRGVHAADRGLATAGVMAAAAGILMCAARQPVVTFALATLAAWACMRFNLTVGIIAVAITASGFAVSASNERLQRAASLEDTEAVSDRVRGSANDSFIDLLVEYPGGAGMGSAVGTSIPYFLADRAPVPVGLENEYAHILVDQGWVGLLIWLIFLGWLLARPPTPRLDARWGLGVILMYALILVNWMTAFIGTGLLASIPGAVLILTQMGILIRVREVRPRETMPRTRP
jgi:hypothetical protein